MDGKNRRNGSGRLAAVLAIAAALAAGAGCKGNEEGLPACTAGADGCACRADGTCDAGLACQDLVCGAPACTTGTLGCPCRADNKCDAGLSCGNGACAAVTGTGLVVGGAEVRACDVVFAAAGATAVFSQDVVGVTARRGERIALSFTAKKDAAFAGPVASVTGADGKAVAGLAPEKASCFDRLGKAVATPDVKVQ